MSDELEALLRDHYRAAADEIHAEPATVRRFQEVGQTTGRPAAPASGVRRWGLPLLAAAVTAAVVMAVTVLLWPGRGAGRQELPRPMAPPTSTPAPGTPPGTPLPAPLPSRPAIEPSRIPDGGTSEARPSGRSGQPPSGAPLPARPKAKPSPEPTQ